MFLYFISRLRKERRSRRRSGRSWPLPPPCWRAGMQTGGCFYLYLFPSSSSAPRSKHGNYNGSVRTTVKTCRWACSWTPCPRSTAMASAVSPSCKMKLLVYRRFSVMIDGGSVARVTSIDPGSRLTFSTSVWNPLGCIKDEIHVTIKVSQSSPSHQSADQHISIVWFAAYFTCTFAPSSVFGVQVGHRQPVPPVPRPPGPHQVPLPVQALCRLLPIQRGERRVYNALGTKGDRKVLNDDIMLYRRRLETRDWGVNSCLPCLLGEYIKREGSYIQESPPGGQERECSFITQSIDFYTTRGVAPWWSEERMQLSHMKHSLVVINQTFILL